MDCCFDGCLIECHACVEKVVHKIEKIYIKYGKRAVNHLQPNSYLACHTIIFKSVKRFDNEKV
jgi:hypothetical protein